MRDHGQEVVLGAVGALRLGARRFRLAIEPCVVERQRRAARQVLEQRQVVGTVATRRFHGGAGDRAERAAARHQRDDHRRHVAHLAHDAEVLAVERHRLQPLGGDVHDEA